MMIIMKNIKSKFVLFREFGISNLEYGSDEKFGNKEDLEKELEKKLEKDPEKERPISNITSSQSLFKVGIKPIKVILMLLS
jgi:hypothetical protein